MSLGPDTKIFIVDDDPFWNTLLCELLQGIGYSDISCFQSGFDCLDHLTENPDVIFLDYDMQYKNGLEVLREVKNYYLGIHVVFTTCIDKVELAVAAMKLGAFDFILKNRVTVAEVENIFGKIRQWENRTDSIF